MTYRFGASCQPEATPGANHLVMSTAINYFRDRGFAQLDFGRTSTFNDGLNRFKDGWNARRYPITYHRWRGRDFTPESATDLAGGGQAMIFRHLPIPVAKLTGRILYRHVA